MIAIGKNPDGNLRICKALKEPSKTVKGEHFHVPRQTGTMEEMTGARGFSKTDVADSWPIRLTGSSFRMHPGNVPVLVSDLETDQTSL